MKRTLFTNSCRESNEEAKIKEIVGDALIAT
jgi:hypothetical protein